MVLSGDGDASAFVVHHIATRTTTNHLLATTTAPRRASQEELSSVLLTVWGPRSFTVSDEIASEG